VTVDGNEAAAAAEEQPTACDIVRDVGTAITSASTRTASLIARSRARADPSVPPMPTTTRWMVRGSRP